MNRSTSSEGMIECCIILSITVSIKDLYLCSEVAADEADVLIDIEFLLDQLGPY